MAGLDALDGLSAWVAWDDEGGRKVPKSSGGNARSNDPSTWMSRGEAEALAREKGYSGVGIMLSDGLAGIDLDGCVRDGEVDPWAREIIDRIGSYAEISPSGTGVHILCRADPSEVGAVGRADHSRGIEVYNHGRYFTVTGDRVNSAGIEDRTAELGAFVSEAFPGESPEESLAKAAGRLVRDQVARRSNETVMQNVWRDRAHGARFARVPMGAEACGFCTMLAGRGFVYHSKKTAGEFDHFHRSCRCKVVPGFPEMEFYYENGTKVSRGRYPSVEGYDPDRYYDMWKHSERHVSGLSKTFNASSLMNREEFLAMDVDDESMPEIAAIYDKNWNPIGDVTSGDADSVSFNLPNGYEWRDLRLMHTHTGEFGGTFSGRYVDPDSGNVSGDIFTLTESGCLSIEAKCSEGVYRLERLDNANPKDFMSAAESKESEFRDEAGGAAIDDFFESHGTPPMSEEDFREVAQSERRIISGKMHEWYNSNAESYGFSYTFEPSK